MTFHAPHRFLELPTSERAVGTLAQQLLRSAITQRLSQADADTKLVAVLHNLLAGETAAATDAADLRRRIARQGYELRLVGGVLSIYAQGTDRWICNTDALGITCLTFIRRFGAGQPPRTFARAS